MTVFGGEPYRLIKDLSGNPDFYTGTIPGWLVDNSSGGTVTGVSGTDGGYLKFDTGSSSGNTAVLTSSFAINLDAYARIDFEIDFKVTTTSSIGSVTMNLLDGGSNNGIQYWPLDANSDFESKFAVLDSGSRTYALAPEKKDAKRHTACLTVDTIKNEGRLSVDGFPAEKLNISGIPLTNNYDFELYTSSSNDLITHLYDMNVRLYQSGRA